MWEMAEHTQIHGVHEPQRQDEEGGQQQHQPPQPRRPRAQNRREASERREKGQRVKQQICSDGLTWKPTFGALASDFERQKMIEVPSGSSEGWLF
ncbi:hypothetical protein KOW79_001484 [Hemibagrus wyckioides]|uniref:Uncharacterized protein n=1 Tax=Hemibagrus wyckioides TaxID=337641 RepID=A0A9D3P8N6_9TELE|nr:hypothetical protein KOW79_001484 [Hemibagrus wyckioides]